MLLIILWHADKQLRACVVKLIKPPDKPGWLRLPPNRHHINRNSAQDEDESDAHLPGTDVARERNQEGADQQEDDRENDTDPNGSLHVGVLVSEPEEARDADGREKGLHEGDVVDQDVDVFDYYQGEGY